jgi:tRNA-dihydrouridine synthase
LPSLARRLAAAGADAVHVDAMDNEGVVACVADACDAAVIANNGVRDRRTVREYLACGADAVSLGRPSDDPVVRQRVARAVREWFADHEGSEFSRDGVSPGESAGVGRRVTDESTHLASDESTHLASDSSRGESARDGGVSR